MELRIKSFPLFQLAVAAVLAGGLLWFYLSDLVNLFNELAGNEDYSFGLLLPLVSAYLIYLKWPQLRSLPRRPSWWGLLIMTMGFGLYVFGELLAIFYFPPISFLIVITGLILLIAGWQVLRLMAFPLFLLLCMIPPPTLIMKQVTFPLQLISSQLAAGFLQAVGIPVVRSGNIIDLGVRQLQVVSACSGLRYILSLAALGMIYCYFYQRRLWKAALLMISLVPAAIIANAIRVAAMGVVPALQEGFLHSFSGWLIFVVCCGLLASFNWVLNYLQPSLPPPDSKVNPAEEKVPEEIQKVSYSPYLLAALALVLIISPVARSLSHANPVRLIQSFDNFPLQIGPWQGRRGYLDSAMAEAVGADDYLEAIYTDGQNKPISVWMAFFGSQNKDVSGRRSIHSPQLCLAGSGWNFLESKIVEALPGLPVRYLLMEQKNSRSVVYYWYLQRGRWFANEYPYRLYLGLDGLLRQRNDGAIIRLITSAEPNVELARQRLDSFVRLLVPILPQFIPK